MIDISKLKTSWTKYDIVQVMDVIHDRKTLNKYLSGEAKINQAVLRAFLGIKKIDEPIPSFWYEILDFPKEKSLFALFALIFTHGKIVSKFANQYSQGRMKGTFVYENGKQYTNLRSALVESGAAELYLRRSHEVPYDFSPIFNNLKVGKLFKKLLINRINRISNVDINNADFYSICYENNFHKAISANKELFKSWCEGKEYKSSTATYIESVKIKNFYSIEDVEVTIPEDTREVYFLGENGDGKSLILMAIYLAFNRHYIINETEKEETGKVFDILRNNENSVLEGIDSKGRTYTSKFGAHIDNLFAYGTYRGRYASDRSERYGFMSLFDKDEVLASPVAWLKDQKLRELSAPNQDQYDSSLNIENIQKLFFEILEKNITVEFLNGEVFFIEKGRRLEFDHLSEGYRSVIVFIIDLLLRLQRVQPKIKSMDGYFGTVLVDEIDLHLHPKWQRVLIPKLRSILPNIQFIFTTHSPNIIQGASDNAIIFRVYRNNNDGLTRLSEPYLRKDINHLMINSLLTSPLFGLADSRMNSIDEYADTSENYLLYRIHKKLEDELQRQKLNGKSFISTEDIDSIIDDLLQSELEDND